MCDDERRRMVSPLALLGERAGVRARTGLAARAHPHPRVGHRRSGRRPARAPWRPDRFRERRRWCAAQRRARARTRRGGRRAISTPPTSANSGPTMPLGPPPPAGQPARAQITFRTPARGRPPREPSLDTDSAPNHLRRPHPHGAAGDAGSAAFGRRLPPGRSTGLPGAASKCTRRTRNADADHLRAPGRNHPDRPAPCPPQPPAPTPTTVPAPAGRPSPTAQPVPAARAHLATGADTHHRPRPGRNRPDQPARAHPHYPRRPQGPSRHPTCTAAVTPPANPPATNAPPSSSAPAPGS